MGLFNSKLRYALCAVIELAAKIPGEACQSREISTRQKIPGPYLDQILAALKGAGIVRSVRGAGGGYCLASPPDQISAGDVVQAVMRRDGLVSGSLDAGYSPEQLQSASWIVQQFEEKVESEMQRILRSTTVADLLHSRHALDDALSVMPDI